MGSTTPWLSPSRSGSRSLFGGADPRGGPRPQRRRDPHRRARRQPARAARHAARCWTRLRPGQGRAAVRREGRCGSTGSTSHYHLGIDGLSVWFVLLTAFITVIVVLAGWEVIESRVAQYYAAFLILSGLMVGVFAAADGLLFYVFFEATLIPMYIIIGVWGGSNRVYAALKFFLYTLARLAAAAGRAGLPVHSVRRQVRPLRLASGEDRHDAADPALPRVPRRLRGQGADVAGAHLAAGRPRGGADRRLDRAGRDHAEARRLRLPALLAADRAGRRARARPAS